MKKLRRTDLIRKGLLTAQNDQTGQIIHLLPSKHQLDVLDDLDVQRFTLVIKYRQARITTLAVWWLLVECALNPGYRGCIIAQDWPTAHEAMRRLSLARRELLKDWPVLEPLLRVTHENTEDIEFAHGGGIVCMSGGSTAPSIGRSIDRLVITEAGMWKDLKGALKFIAPVYRKRPHSKVLIESTPGAAGCDLEQMVKDALTGESEWFLRFLDWREATEDPEAFRKSLLMSEYMGDERLFQNQYPDTVLNGFTISGAPTIPPDLVLALPALSLPDNVSLVPQGSYILTCDPSGFGDQGDPSGLIAWREDKGKLIEEATLLINEDPGLLATRISQWVTTLRLGGSTVRSVIPESNAAALVQALRDMPTIPLYWSTRQQPGWHATFARKGGALGKLVGGLRNGKLVPRSAQTKKHLLNYSGGEHREDGHHFELVVCAYIAADFLIPDITPTVEAPIVIQSIFDVPYHPKSSSKKQSLVRR